ncbi:uncharacterized protein LOC115745936 [Rhodamnia argentea]|uniref:Uncharacterized protein LOC115745936 n=1 Tax=Rhodamnia argentea TaxID=178133 RepID=A0A8B8PRM4_9MYRT|nr:uncharacterized protein LOC115745936 [Rhodamnia argentea]XP_030537432.1 uncharacterized protein LOC115745936 [Rhodamnia argentea]XP_048136750.1 uncharacterized protein LOC115745936 [Rhodamnia argentea]XP_048136751.1 uncharacterized protein LOC115745936 [Rhodamnia argentea]
MLELLSVLPVDWNRISGRGISMEDSRHNSTLNKNPETTSFVPGKKVSQTSLVASRPKTFSKNKFNYRHIASLGHGRIRSSVFGDLAFFLLKVAALESVRRFSRAKCPIAWRGLQALQLLCYPPLKWLQRWAPFRGLVKGMQTLSRPLLVLSVATAFSDQEEPTSESLDAVSDCQEYSNVRSDPATLQHSSDAKCMICNEAPQILASENWLVSLHKELEDQGITLPDRMDEDELRRFHVAANGDFSSLVSSIKRTILWRETYRLLTEEELEVWSNLLFWHGVDLRHRPCLIVRLGLAFISLPPHERPRFSQAVISQVECGVLRLVNSDSTRITVVVDCQGLSPYRIPMQIIRSCLFLLQDHYPGRLGCVFVIRLRPVLRVICQTLVQVLRPSTREKLRIHGENYQKVLAESLQTLPLYLGGNCNCTSCRIMSNCDVQQRSETESPNSGADFSDVEDREEQPHVHNYERHRDGNANWDLAVKTAMLVILMLLALVTLLSDPEHRPL